MNEILFAKLIHSGTFMGNLNLYGGIQQLSTWTKFEIWSKVPICGGNDFMKYLLKSSDI